MFQLLLIDAVSSHGSAQQTKDIFQECAWKKDNF